MAGGCLFFEMACVFVFYTLGILKQGNESYDWHGQIR